MHLVFNVKLCLLKTKCIFMISYFRIVISIPLSRSSPDFVVYPRPVLWLRLRSSQKLKRDHCQGCCKVRVCFRDVDGEVCGILDIVIAKCGQAHKVGATALALNHIADCFFVEIRLGQHTDHKSSVFDQGDSSMFQLSCRIGSEWM